MTVSPYALLIHQIFFTNDTGQCLAHDHVHGMVDLITDNYIYLLQDSDDLAFHFVHSFGAPISEDIIQHFFDDGRLEQAALVYPIVFSRPVPYPSLLW